MAEKIKLFVNGEEVEVESGKNLIDAVGAVGIEIPHLCYHPALGADGNCRMCLVGIEDGRPPLVPACKTPALEGMKVQLDTDKIKKIQQDIMEFELINHPIDCPVCDQAGECSLQDYYMKYDCQSSRMTVEQVKKGKKMDFGGGVVHDQERCVLCGRCVRFCRQITKSGELGIANRTDAARVVIFPGRPLANRYALNVVDLCPVGAMTSADFRFRQRVWFLQKDEGICHGCSRGCNIYVDHNREKYKDDLIYRFRPRYNEQINGYFICDEGRLSYKLENDGRLLETLKKGRGVGRLEGIEAAAKAISGADKVVILLSPGLSVEQMVATQALAKKIGGTISGFSDGYIKKDDGDDFLIQDDKSANRAALALLDIDSTADFFYSAVDGADLILSVGNDLRGVDDKTLKKVLRDKVIIALSRHRSAVVEQADIAIPIASWTEYSGTVINCDNILQFFDKAVSKNSPAADAVEVLHLLGGPLASRDEILSEIRKSSTPLAKVDFTEIPAEGLKLI
ncbi:MAG: 2Fe-2S iron-sulfur cluster-binding protein [Desulfopila sp.]